MSKTSLPSRPIFIIDSNETNLSAKFVYNFYTKDEITNDRLNPSEYLGSLQFERYSNRIPRYVSLSWNPILVSTEITNANEQQDLFLKFKNAGKNIANSYSQIIFEDQLSSQEFFAYNFHDYNLNEKMYIEVSSSQIFHQFEGDLIDNDGKLKFLSSVAEKISDENVQKLFSNTIGFDDLSYGVLKRKNEKKLNSQMDIRGEEKLNFYFDKLKSIKMNLSINSKFGSELIKNSIYDPFIPYENDFNMILPRLQELRDVIGNIPVNSYSSLIYQPSMEDPIVSTVGSINSKPRFVTMGYVIDKFEIMSNGFEKKHDPIIIENSLINNFYDFNVKYGSQYIYSIRIIFLIEKSYVTNQHGINRFNWGCFLISSKSSCPQFVKTVEKIAPAPPVDFNIFWDYAKQKPYLTWGLPTNSQRDIKKIQIFRRKSLEHPFELIQVHDFSDPEHNFPSLETPSHNLIKKMRVPQNCFNDEDFSKSSSFIYALCCIDAHGLSSNYSVQFEIKFDSLKNELIKKAVSHAGAPKSYPNLYLDGKGMLDVAHVKNHKKMFLYFTPQAYYVQDSNSSKKIIETQKTGGYYSFNFINTDNLKSEIIKINILDKMD